jgi:hypothetical protein
MILRIAAASAGVARFAARQNLPGMASPAGRRAARRGSWTMVKITGFGPAPVTPTRPARAVVGSGRFRVATQSSETAETQDSAPVDGVSIAPSLLALQETFAAGERDARSRRRAEGMLDELAALQLGLLAGRLPRGRLESHAALAAEPEVAADPRLAAIAAEIGVRAAVELARLDRAATARPASETVLSQ